MIRVSYITTYLKCPRMCYFLFRGHELIKYPTADHIQKLLLKELALTYGTAAAAKNRLDFLNDELNRLSNDIRIIYRQELEGCGDNVIADAVSGVRLCLGEISSHISPEHYTSPCEFEPVLQSDKFGLSGSPSRLINMGSDHIPSIIKTGSMPENGVWKSDRVQLTAYAILVEEIYNTVTSRGFVEYARWGIVREVAIKHHERRKILQLRDRVRKIQEGFMPEKPADAPCDRCSFHGICDVKSTLASKFF